MALLRSSPLARKMGLWMRTSLGLKGIHRLKKRMGSAKLEPQTALIVTLAALAIGVFFAFIRATLGPTAFDRVLAVNTIGTIAVLVISVHGFWAGRPEFLDIALLYALINFIGTIAVLKFFRFGTLGDHPPRHKEDA